MRWPWERVPWGRGRETDASEATAGAADHVAPGPTMPPATEVSAAPTGLPAAWTRLPALQRSVADTTAVAPPAAFRASLTTHQNPSFLAPLGHLVDPDGPAGVVGGLASSVAGPLSYEGVDELRVPDRPAPPPAPAVQRRIATLQPESSTPPAEAPTTTGRSDAEPEWAADPAAPAGENQVDLGAAEPLAPPASTRPVPEALVVSRSATSDAPAPASGTAETLGSQPGRPMSVPDLSTPAAPSSTTPTEAPVLALPVQRSTAPGTARTAGNAPGKAASESIPATLRPTLSPPAAVDEPRGPAVEDVSPTTPSPPSAPELSAEPVVARTAVAAAALPAAPDEVVGLVAERAPHPPASFLADDLGSPATTADPVALPVPGGTPSGPTLQRSVSEQTSAVAAPAPVAAPGPGAPLVLSESAPAVKSPRGLDDQGYPPLVARSVQRRLEAADSAGPAAPGPPASSAAPLSGFSAAISTLQEDPVEPPVTGVDATAYADAGAPPRPDLVVARRVVPDQTGQLPASAVALQRLGASTGRPVPVLQTVQRSLIADRSPVATLPGASGTAASVSPAPPAVQRVRYENPAAAPGGPSPVQRPGVTDAQPAPFPGQPIDDAGLEGGPEAVSTSLPLAPAAAAWSPVALAPASGGGAGSLSASSPVGPPPAGTPFSAVQRTIAAARGEAPVPGGGVSHPESAHLPLAAPASGGNQPLLVQRSFDAPSASFSPTDSSPATSITPPGSADQPAMAVSSRTVGLAEMFAMAAAQSPSAQFSSGQFSSGQHGAPGADGLAVQRSADTDVQRTALDSTGSEAAGAPTGAGSATTSAAPGGPAAPAAPLSGAELEEMARRLYEPLSARLRAELWQDRERSGLLTDLRP